MLVVNRFEVPDTEAKTVADDLAAAHAALAAKPGYVDGAIGRNLDDPTLWVLQTRWANVGSYRRALSAYDVKLGAVPLLARAIDEPSAYEVVDVTDPEGLNAARPRGSRG